MIYLTLKTTWTALDIQDEEKKVKISPGRYEMERVVPKTKTESWLVFKGTRFGRREKVWKHFQDSPNEIQIIIEET